MWFPINGMSEGIITIMNCLPFRNATVLIQNVLNGISNPFNDFWQPLIIVLAYAIVAFAAVILCFKKKMKA